MRGTVCQFLVNVISAMISVLFFRSRGWRLLLYLRFCRYLVREILSLSRKSQGILKIEMFVGAMHIINSHMNVISVVLMS